VSLITSWLPVVMLHLSLMPPLVAAAGGEWRAVALRPEMRPRFERRESAAAAEEQLSIQAENRPGLAGAWVAEFPVGGGQHYRFSCLRKTDAVRSPRRSAVVKIIWQNAAGQLVPGRSDDLARPEYPGDGDVDRQGWTEVSGTYHVPDAATQARIELHLRWAPAGQVTWKSVRLKTAQVAPQRRVRLATVHFRPQGKTSAAENRAAFAPLIAEAGRQQADLVCLGEALTMVGTKLSYVDVAEPIPGPSTAYFGKLARKHDLYIVAGLLERSGAAVYNTAVLLGPSGKLLGKYRKVCLPREEIEGGVTPGETYPVFQTRFGKLGMMICWDVHFPEVARELSAAGAEVIAMPIWGGNPALARARAIENQVFLVSSTYTDPARDWMKSGVWDQEGRLLTVGERWGTVKVVEVDLGQRKYWKWLGDFKARIHRERPAIRRHTLPVP